MVYKTLHRKLNVKPALSWIEHFSARILWTYVWQCALFCVFYVHMFDNVHCFAYFMDICLTMCIVLRILCTYVWQCALFCVFYVHMFDNVHYFAYFMYICLTMCIVLRILCTCLTMCIALRIFVYFCFNI